jgi:hypothetical protein
MLSPRVTKEKGPLALERAARDIANPPPKHPNAGQGNDYRPAWVRRNRQTFQGAFQSGGGLRRRPGLGPPYGEGATVPTPLRSGRCMRPGLRRCTGCHPLIWSLARSSRREPARPDSPGRIRLQGGSPGWACDGIAPILKYALNMVRTRWARLSRPPRTRKALRALR